MSGPPILSLAGVGFAYDTAGPAVLDGISLEIPSGATTAILGPNGAGKTTLLHLVLGLLAPSTGDLSVCGRSRRALTRRELSRLVALVPQNEHVPFDFSVLEYVLMGRSPHISVLGMPADRDHEVAIECLRTLGLLDLWHRPVPELSGGERQLVTLARALAQDTPILLLDEPAAHLDVGNALRLHAIVERLAGRGTTVVFTTHDPAAAAAVARHIVLLRAGRVLASGPTEEVFTSERLTEAYGVPIRVVAVEGQTVVLPGPAA